MPRGARLLRTVTHMKYAAITASGFLYAVLAATPVPAQELPKGALCALADIQECDIGKTCDRVSAEEIAVPRFIRVELADRTLHGLGPRSRDRVTKIESLSQRRDIIFAGGVDDDNQNERGALGWVLALTPTDGSMTMTITGDNVTFIASGECLIDK